MMAVPFTWNVYRPNRIDKEGAFSDEVSALDNIGIVYGTAEIHNDTIVVEITDVNFDIRRGDILEPDENIDFMTAGGAVNGNAY